MDVDVQDAEPAHLALPVAAAPSLSNPRAERRASAREVVARQRQRRDWATGWDYPIRVAIKGTLLVAIAALGIVLAGYAGVLPLLPTTPPAMDVAGATQRAHVVPSSSCWLSPGAGGCTDGTPDAGLTPAAPITARPGRALTLHFGYPAPTACAATGAASATPDVGAALKITPSQPGALMSGYTLLAPATPGTYAVSVVCEWNPHRSLRWLRGFGNATYALALRVVAG
ncbi:MAG TPA: hypothetical protein VGR57_19015 [Ktedonobacterales bacterium]|nr:hypothetical protein [Ktedonobacterales bacterium]